MDDRYTTVWGPFRGYEVVERVWFQGIEWLVYRVQDGMHTLVGDGHVTKVAAIAAAKVEISKP